MKRFALRSKKNSNVFLMIDFSKAREGFGRVKTWKTQKGAENWIKMGRTDLEVVEYN